MSLAEQVGHVATHPGGVAGPFGGDGNRLQIGAPDDIDENGVRDHRGLDQLPVGRLVDPDHLKLPFPDHHRPAHPGASGEELSFHW